MRFQPYLMAMKCRGDTRQALENMESALAIADDSYPYINYLKETKARLQIALGKDET